MGRTSTHLLPQVVLTNPGWLVCALRYNLANPSGLFENNTCEGLFVPSQPSVVPLRKQAVEALQKSTTMFKQAYTLLKQGRREAANELLNEARAKRNDSVWLMAKANELDNASHPH